MGRSRLLFAIALAIACATVAGIAWLSVSGASGPATTSVSPATSNVKGDVTCDGSIDAVDALQVLRSAAGMTSSAQCLEAAGDVDCDGDRDAVDALKILRHTAGLPADTPGCTPIGQPLATSDELIEEALAAGKISDEEATIYRVFAAFGDGRLPDEYRGAPSDLPDSDAAMIAAVKFGALSQEGQEILRPFLTPPYAEGSWLELPTAGGAAVAAAADAPTPTINPADWTTFEAADGKVKVWGRSAWPTEVLKAEAIADAVTDTIWPSLIALMGEEHAPLSDLGYPNNGGDAALDVYVVDIDGALGLTIPYIDIPEDPNTGGPIGPCEMSPAYILIEPDEPIGSATEPGIVSTVAHEVFHAFQMSFDLYTNCWFPEYKWFMEASATWAEDHVYPAANAEHVAAGAYLSNPATSLDYAGPFSPGHEYGAYLFPFYVTHKLDSPGLVRTMWEGFTTANSLPAINAALEPYGGFDTLWPEFVLYNWNGSTTSWYKEWDGLEDGATLDTEVVVYPPSGGSPDELEGKFYYLAARYYKVHFPNWDAFPVRAVTFKNPLWQNPAINVQAIAKIGDKWQQAEDLSRKEEVTFCRDEDEAKRMEQMIIIISNSDWRTMQDIKPAVPPALEGSEAPCSRWVGEATLTLHRDNRAFLDVMDLTIFAHDLEFEPAPDQEGVTTATKFLLKKGTLDFSVTFTVDCTATYSHTYDATDNGGGDLTVTASGDHLSYRGRVYTYLSGSTECWEGPGHYTFSWSGDYAWFWTGPVDQVSDDLSHLAGEYTHTHSGGDVIWVTEHYTWDLHAAPVEASPAP